MRVSFWSKSEEKKNRLLYIFLKKLSNSRGDKTNSLAAVVKIKNKKPLEPGPASCIRIRDRWIVVSNHSPTKGSPPCTLGPRISFRRNPKSLRFENIWIDVLEPPLPPSVFRREI